jgi:hypothetical protein
MLPLQTKPPSAPDLTYKLHVRRSDIGMISPAGHHRTIAHCLYSSSTVQCLWPDSPLINWSALSLTGTWQITEQETCVQTD